MADAPIGQVKAKLVWFGYWVVTQEFVYMFFSKLLR